MSKTKAQLQEELSKIQCKSIMVLKNLEHAETENIKLHEVCLERLAKINQLEAKLEVSNNEIRNMKIWIHGLRGLDYQGKPFPDVKDGS